MFNPEPLVLFGRKNGGRSSPSNSAVGGPLLTPAGLVAGIVGGSTTPGSRLTRHDGSISPALWRHQNSRVAVVPIEALSKGVSDNASRFQALIDKGIWTASLKPVPMLVYGGASRDMTIGQNGFGFTDASEFSHRDAVMWIYTVWQKKTDVGKGVVSAKLYDANNRVIVDVDEKKI